MRLRVLSLLAVPVVLGTVLASVAFAGGQSQLAEVRAATAAYHDIEAAKDAGYTVELPDIFGKTCIADLRNPSAGAMGVHMVSLARVMNPDLDPSNPEVLVYERRNNGSLKLVAVEYVVFDSGQAKPAMFGQGFDSNNGSRYGLPAFYALHAWVWKPNPSESRGIFSEWNPRVHCD